MIFPYLPPPSPQTFSKDDIYKKHNIWLVDNEGRPMFNISGSGGNEGGPSSRLDGSAAVNATLADGGSHPYWPCQGLAWEAMA